MSVMIRRAEAGWQRKPVLALRQGWQILKLVTIIGALTACTDASPHASGVRDAPPWGDLCVVRDVEAACTDCITLTHIAELGSDEQAGFLREDGTIDDIVRDRDGNFWVGQTTHINVYDSAGRFKGSVGREGEGPLEFLDAQPAHADRHGLVHVFDPGNLRITAITNQMTLASERPLPSYTMDMAPLADGEMWVIQSWIATPDRIGLPLHVVSGREITESFGIPTHAEEQDGPRTAMSTRRVVTTDINENVYSAEYFAYNIDVWSRNGDFRGTISGPPLNETALIPGPYTYDNPPQNQLYAMRVDAAGHIWLAFLMRRDNWRENVTEQVDGEGQVSLRPNDGTIHSVYNSRLDVLRPSDCRMVARHDYDGILMSFLADGSVAELRYADGHYPRIQIWQLALRRRDLRE